MLIDSSYFNGRNNIPNNTYNDVVSIIDSLINFYEPQYMEAVLGYELYKAFTTGIADLAPEQRFTDIKIGKEYTGLDGRMKKWRGLVSTEKESPIADYAYYWYLRKSVNSAAGTGQVQAKNENSTIVTCVRQQAEAYNNMVDKTLLLVEMLQTDYLTYPEFLPYAGTSGMWRFLRKINAYNF